MWAVPLFDDVTAGCAGWSASFTRKIRDLGERLAGAGQAVNVVFSCAATSAWKWGLVVTVERHAACPSCGTPTGSAHQSGCDISRCRWHGERLVECLGDGAHAPDTYQGVYPGTLEAVDRGWFYTAKDGQRYPDINRVMSELTWSSDLERFV